MVKNHSQFSSFGAQVGLLNNERLDIIFILDRVSLACIGVCLLFSFCLIIRIFLYEHE